MALHRRTRAIVFSEAPTDLRSSVETHVKARQLDLEDARCWLTRIDNPIANGFVAKMFKRRINPVDPDAWSFMLVALHRTHVVVGTLGERSGTATFSAPHLSLSLQEDIGAKLGLSSGPGFSLHGFPSPVEGQGASLFVALGNEAAAEECLTEVKAALWRAKNG